MNKIHWTRIEHRVGSETTRKLKILFEYYTRTKVCDFFKKESTLLEIGKILKTTNTAELVVCPHFGAETIRGVVAQKVNLVICDEIPKRFSGFIGSGILEVIQELGISLEILVSTKEFFEVSNPDLYSKFEDYYCLVEKSKEVIERFVPGVTVSTMKQESARYYTEHFLPQDYSKHVWPQDFWVPQTKHQIVNNPDKISIQSEVLHYPKKASFYKDAFGKEPLPVIGYRVPKKY